MIRLRSKQRRKPTVQITVSPGGITGIDLVTPRPGSMSEQDRLFGFYLYLLEGIDLLERGARKPEAKHHAREPTYSHERRDEA